MEYKGIQFTVRARLGRDNWVWTIFPKDGRPVARDFIGVREGAITAAYAGIDRLLERQARLIKELAKRGPGKP
jgi:hypothetical protein